MHEIIIGDRGEMIAGSLSGAIKEADRKTSSRNLAKADLHPMHGALKRIIHVSLPDGSIKSMKVKTALQKGYIKSR